MSFCALKQSQHKLFCFHANYKNINLILLPLVSLMRNYESHKRRNMGTPLGSHQSRMIELPISTGPYDQCQSYRKGPSEMEAPNRSSSAIKRRVYEQDKENFNYIQVRHEKYSTPLHSPLKPQVTCSPLKPASSLQFCLTGRGNSRSKDPSDYSPLTSRELKYGLKKYEDRSNQIKYFYDNFPDVNENDQTIQGIVNDRKRYSSKVKAEKNQSTNTILQQNQKSPISYSSISDPYVCHTTTPHKPVLQVDELVEKSEFLKQRLERIGRMTPRGSSRRHLVGEQLNFDITPQKICAQTTAPKPEITFNQLPQNITHSMKNNKYYCQLSLDTIYDIEEHRAQQEQTHPSRPTENDDGDEDERCLKNEGIDKISQLSRKISDRLRNIINRHSHN